MSVGRQNDPWNWDVNDNADSQERKPWDNHPPGTNQHAPKDPRNSSIFDNSSTNISQSSNKQSMDPSNFVWDMNNQSAYHDHVSNQRPPVSQESRPVDSSRPPSNIPVCNSFNQDNQNHPFPQHSQMFPSQAHHNRNEHYSRPPSNHYPPEVAQPNLYSKQSPPQSTLPLNYPTPGYAPVPSNSQLPSHPPNIPPPQSTNWDGHGLSNFENLENPYSHRPIDGHRVNSLIQSNRHASSSPVHSVGSDMNHQADNNEIPKPFDPPLFNSQDSFRGASQSDSNCQMQFTSFAQPSDNRSSIRNLQQPLNDFNLKQEEKKSNHSSEVPLSKQDKNLDTEPYHSPREQRRTSQSQIEGSRNTFTPPTSINSTATQFQQMSLNSDPFSSVHPPANQVNFSFSMDMNAPNMQNPPKETPKKQSDPSNDPHLFFQGNSLSFENGHQPPPTGPEESFPPAQQPNTRAPYYNNPNTISSGPPSNSGVQIQQVKPSNDIPQVARIENTASHIESSGANIGNVHVDQGNLEPNSSKVDLSRDSMLKGPPVRNYDVEPKDIERRKLSKDGRQDAMNRMFSSGGSSFEMPVNPTPDQAQAGVVDNSGSSQRPPQWQPEQLEHSKLTSNRDEYLETGNLSAPNDKSKQPTPQPSMDMTEEGDDPPPGLHRMVTGQVCDISLNKPDDSSRVPSPGANYSSVNYAARDSSTPLSNNGNDLGGRLLDDGTNNIRPQGRLVQGQSIGEDNDSVREIPGEANPSNGRVVVGFMGPDSQQQPSEHSGSRESSKDLDRGRKPPNRMVVGDFRHSRNDSDGMNAPEYYNSYRGRPRHPRDSPDYLSDEDFDDLRRGNGYHRRDRRPRERGDRGDPDDLREPYRDDRRYRPRYDYGRDDDYYYSRSRPSSRSGSDYRRVNDYNMGYPAPSHHMRHYYPGGPPGGYPRDYSEFNKRDWTEFCDNYRRVDPIGYAHWYYSQYMPRANVSSASYSNGRASVHSGQSSTHAPCPLPKEGMDDDVTTLDDSIANEYNPMLYSTAHARGNIDSHGRVIAVDPHYPLDRQTASVKILHGGLPPCDYETEEFLLNPGPFVAGLTNKNIVLTYLKNIIDRSGDEGERLLCSLFHLMVKLNGVMSGSDIAELLLDNYKSSGASYTYEDRNWVDGTRRNIAVEKYRQHLLDGNRTGALEWAMEVGLWGHAFYLASKLDEKTYNNVLVRFTNSIPSTDPIQSLYQFLNGVIPQAATSCSDPKWADWRPHLAMLLSNQQSTNPDFTREAVITLAESLGSKGRLFESHFCYVVAQLDNRYSSQNDRMPLVGIDLNNINNPHTPCRPIMLTICYEFARRLSQPSFYLPSLLKYKLLLATRLIDYGKQKVATQYIETLANEVVFFNVQDLSLLSSLTELGTRLKPFNPNITQLGVSLPDPDWLTTLNSIYSNLIRENKSAVDYNSGGDVVHHSTPVHNPPPLSYTSQIDGPISIQDLSSVPPVVDQPPMYNPTSIPLLPVETAQEELKLQPPIPTQFSEHLPNEQHHILKPIANYNADISPVHNPIMPVHEDHHHTSHPPPLGGPPEMPPLDRPEPFMEKPKQGFNYYSQTDEMFKMNESKSDKDRPPSSNGSKKEGQLDKSGEKGWFGGILKRFNPLQRNQMHLPDDSNPSIVWDEDKKKWVNLEGGDDPSEQIQPPPKMSQVPQPSAPAGGNLYKLQKGKNFKSNYVNVMHLNSRPGDKPSGPNSFTGHPPSMHAPPSDAPYLGGPVS